LVKPLVGYFVPESLRREGGLAERRAGLVVKTASILALIDVVYTTLFLTVLESAYGILVPSMIGATAVVNVAALFTLRRTASPTIATNVILVPNFILVSVMSGLTGGLGTQVTGWLMILVLVAIVYAGERTGKVWLGLSVAVLTGFFVAEKQGVQFSQMVSNDTDQALNLYIGEVVLLVAVYWLITVGRDLQSWLVDNMREQKADIQTMLQTAPDGIIAVDGTGEVAQVNPAATETFRGEREDLEGRPVVDLVPDLSREGFHSDGGEFQTGEFHAERPDGGTFPVRVSFEAYGDERPGGILAIRDITPLKEREDKLREARDRALEASRAKSAFLANMSHELRTPMNAIMGYSEMLMGDVDRVQENDDQELSELIPPDRLYEDLDRINTAGDHLLAMIDDVLDLSKIEAGQVNVHYETVDFEEFFGDLESTVRPLAADNANELVVEGGGEVGEMRTDRKKVRQILFNLASNACKFTDEGMITIRAERSASGETVTFEVADTGIGMTEEEADRIFEAFKQADESTTREYGGTGLGLALVDQFVGILNGELNLETAPGEGTTFRIELPDEAETGPEIVDSSESGEEMSPVAEEPAVADGGSEVSGGGETVLVIDDDPDVRDLLGRVLERAGFEVATAATGGEGLTLAEKLEPTVITLDLKMPGMDGREVLSRLKDDPALADVPVVLVTMISERSRGMVVDADHYMTKPVDRNELLEVLGEYRSRESDSILVVEDDTDTRELMVRTLEKEGWEAISATNGAEAFELLGDHDPALCLLDLMMPEVDGFDFLAQLQGSPYEDLPIVVVTAKELTERDREVLEDEVIDIVRKGGYDRDDLLDQIQRRVEQAAGGEGSAS
jgi:PAS domain S-box-containing protein